jgi:hypothetical protein
VVTHYLQGSCQVEWLRQLASEREEHTRPHLKWAGRRMVTVYVGSKPQVTTTYRKAADLIRGEA